MPEELETILRLVAEGKLSPDDAAPIIDALTRAERSAEALPRHDRFGRRIERAGRRLARAQERIENAVRRADERRAASHSDADSQRGRQLRIRVTERGRQVVNLRIPIGFVDAALGFVPGLGGDQSERIRDAVRSGATGPIIDVEDPDGDGVLISVE
jgi:hypothetical protein